MEGTRRTFKALILGLAALVTICMGAVFPVPPLLILAKRRKTDPTELILPARTGMMLDLDRAEVDARLLDRGFRPRE